MFKQRIPAIGTRKVPIISSSGRVDGIHTQLRHGEIHRKIREDHVCEAHNKGSLHPPPL